MKRCIAFLCILVIAGCGSTRYGVNAPEWIGRRPPRGRWWGIGAAQGSTDTAAAALAQNRGRISIARQLDEIFRETLADLRGGNGSLLRAAPAEGAARRLINLELRNTISVRAWKAPDGRWWSRMEIASGNAETAIMEAVDAERAAAEAAGTADTGFDRAAFQTLLARRLAKRAPPPLVVDH
jgi:hypothetical protein